jgi:hypothetical protein
MFVSLSECGRIFQLNAQGETHTLNNLQRWLSKSNIANLIVNSNYGLFVVIKNNALFSLYPTAFPLRFRDAGGDPYYCLRFNVVPQPFQMRKFELRRY